MKKAILVTGGCGFVGRHLANKLIAKGHSLFIIDNLFTGKHPKNWLTEDWRILKEDPFLVFEKGEVSVTYLERDVLRLFTDTVAGKSDIELPDFSDVYHLASIIGGRSLIKEIQCLWQPI